VFKVSIGSVGMLILPSRLAQSHLRLRVWR